jgi:exodeoxyribonuclease-3
MQIATFNCNSVRTRLPIITGWLEKHKPDVLALQETKAQDADFPEAAFKEAGYHVAFCGQKSYNGVAMITKDKPEFISFGLLDGDNGESNPRLAHIRYHDIDIINTYVPQGQALDSPKFQFKLEWFKRLHNYLDSRFDPITDAVLWLGDLNVAPEPIDVHDSKKIWPHVCHGQEVIDAFTPLLEWGFKDIFRKHLPEADNFTFWDYRVRNALDRGIGWRIDHILATGPLAAVSTSCTVDTEPRRQEKPSDHTFVSADFTV